LDIQFLVFSSQKTATQTILNSLVDSGVNALHCHTLDNIGQTEASFKTYLVKYGERNHRPLNIISVFRDPLERMVSSFFQSLSENKFAYTDPANEYEITKRGQNLICSETNEAVRTLFYNYCRIVDGWGEALSTICSVEEVEIGNLNFSEKQKRGLSILRHSNLYLMRFDLMLPALDRLLSEISNTPITLCLHNMAETKYYFDYYQRFLSSLKLPVELTERMYQSRRALMDLFYPDRFNAILNKKISRHGF
jgi:hypothetical protein